MLPQKVSDLDLAFPTGVSRLMPDLKLIPEEFNNFNNKWVKLAMKWFYNGVSKSELGPVKKGIDSTEAFRHLNCIMGSFEPRQEDKLVSVGYLMSLWFEGK